MQRFTFPVTTTLVEPTPAKKTDWWHELTKLSPGRSVAIGLAVGIALAILVKRR